MFLHVNQFTLWLTENSVVADLLNKSISRLSECLCQMIRLFHYIDESITRHSTRKYNSANNMLEGNIIVMEMTESNASEINVNTRVPCWLRLKSIKRITITFRCASQFRALSVFFSNVTGITCGLYIHIQCGKIQLLSIEMHENRKPQQQQQNALLGEY